jgi:acetyl-CoA C-acetyltransferase
MDPCIIGWEHTRFSKLEDQGVESLIAEVAVGAIAHAGAAPEDVDGVFVGMFNNGVSHEDFPSSLAINAIPAPRFRPGTRTENACASGSAAPHGARDFLATGLGRSTLVIGVDKMTAVSKAQAGDNLLGASYRRMRSA